MEMSDQPANGEGEAGADKLRLKVSSGNAAGSVIEVEDELVIGRQASGAGALANDIEISRQHARITCDSDGRYVIEDLGSTNGTYVNGRAVENPVTLETGDRIEVGASALIVQVSAPPPTPRSSPVTTTSDIDSEPAAEPSAEDVSVEVAGLPRLGLRIDVDLEAGEVAVVLDDDGGEARFIHDGGRWRLK